MGNAVAIGTGRSKQAPLHEPLQDGNSVAGRTGRGKPEPLHARAGVRPRRQGGVSILTNSEPEGRVRRIMVEHAGVNEFRTDLAPAEAALAAPRRDGAETVGAGDKPPAPAAPRVKKDRSYGALVFGIFAVYMGLATALYYFRGVSFITPDRWALALFVAALLLGQGVAFVRDWIPFVFLVFGYEYMRGLAGNMIGANQTDINK